MKKKLSAKLTLGKMKIASLGKQYQQMIKAGAQCPPTNLNTNVIRCNALTACNCAPSQTKCVQG